MLKKDSYRTKVESFKIGRMTYRGAARMPLDPNVFQTGDRISVTVRLLKNRK